jgi:Leucine-rich repeat (LRR) protein
VLFASLWFTLFEPLRHYGHEGLKAIKVFLCALLVLVDLAVKKDDHENHEITPKNTKPPIQETQYMRNSWFVKPLNLVLALVLLLPAAAAPSSLPATAAGFDCSTATGLPKAECEALVAIYNATGGPGWGKQNNWLQTTEPCLWHGVTCQAEHVTNLALISQGMTGAVPPELGDLTYLKYLSLVNNQLTSIPEEIGNLSALVYLDLGSNQISSLPPQVGNLSALQQIELEENLLTSLPEEIENLSQLTRLVASDNLLETLPPEIGNLSNLRYLFVGNNRLTSLPVELGGLTSLESFDLGSNQLIELPDEIGGLVSLRILHLYHNRLTTLPASIDGLVSLEYLGLEDNLFTGLPPELGSLTTLQGLDLTANHLADLPEEFSGLSSLTSLWLGENQLSSLPPSIPSLPSLQRLNLNGNPLSGELPTSLDALSLSEFYFYDTSWCVPLTGSVLSWLETIPFVSSSGLICGRPLGGSMSGKVTLPGGAPAPGAQVNLYRSLGGWGVDFQGYTRTNSQGQYWFGSLGEGVGVAYYVQFLDPDYRYAPQFYPNKLDLYEAALVKIPVGASPVGINAVMTHGRSAGAQIDAPAASVSRQLQEGYVWIGFPHGEVSDVSVTMELTCPGGALPLDPILHMSYRELNFPLSPLAEGGFRAVIPAEHITRGDWLYAWHTCDDDQVSTIVGEILFYTPLGVVRDASSGKEVPGARVTLYKALGWMPKTGPDDDRENTCPSNASRVGSEPWSMEAPLDLGILPQIEMSYLWPAAPVQVTGSSGAYGWELMPGCYYAKVDAPGYRTAYSMFTGSDPVVTDMDVLLRERIIFLPLLNRR